MQALVIQLLVCKLTSLLGLAQTSIEINKKHLVLQWILEQASSTCMYSILPRYCTFPK